LNSSAYPPTGSLHARAPEGHALLATGIVLLFLGGVRLWIFGAGALAAAAAAPLAWSLLRDYQKTRFYTFLDPDRDPLGAGYHILQSKIALGSGGVLGKVLAHLSIIDHYDGFAKGVIDTRDVIYFVNVTALALFLTLRTLEARRWKG